MSSKYLAKLLVAATAAMAVVAVAAPLAQATEPAPGYSQFAGCPSPSENPAITACIHATVTSGTFKMGSKEVPITNPMTLSGGVGREFSNFSFNSKGGLSPVKQKVPGGVVGLTGLTWLLELLGSEALTLYAVTELAGTPQVGIQNITLPIKVHLINGVLGNSCYVGSTSNPITLHLTTGTTNPPPPNKPITGKEPSPNFEPVREIFYSNNGKYVDNAFSAPGASGCVLTLFGFIPISINSLVDSQSGLPAAAGTNETIQYITSELTESELVYP
jgi:hypothetical protein